MLQQNAQQELISKLDAFIRRYYQNQVIRGGIYLVILVLLLFLSAAVLEYYGHYTTAVRASLFYGVLCVSGYFLTRYVVIPVMQMFRIGKQISHEQAAKIIGDHFPDIRDRLLNTLQLTGQSSNEGQSLLDAAIAQRIRQLSPVRFASAIDLRKNLRYARYLVFPLGLYALILLISPGLISEGGKRLVKYSTTFKVNPPFAFHILNSALSTTQYSDFELSVELTGKDVPNELFIHYQGNAIKMSSVSPGVFAYPFHALKQDVSFELEGGGYHSEPYLLKVIAKPQVVNFTAKFIYPAYLHQASESIENPGDLTVPAGTTIQWNVFTRQADQLLMNFGKQDVSMEEKGANRFAYARKLFVSVPYVFKALNASAGTQDSIAYHIQVIPDAVPMIRVEEKQDSLSPSLRYFMGDAEDDHGLTALTFNYRFVQSDDLQKVKQSLKRIPVPFAKGERSSGYTHQIDLKDLGVSPSDELEYYFEVWDNDGVTGPKSSRTGAMSFKAPSIKQLEANSEKQSSSLKDKMEEAIRDARELQQELKAAELKMQENKEFTWEEKKKLEALMQRQKELSEKIADIKKEQQQLDRRDQEFRKETEEIRNKQEQLNKLFNEVMNDEMKQLIKRLEQMMEKQNKDALKQEMDKMELSNKDVEKELDRMLEQYKQLELEKRLEETTEKLDDLAKKQEELARKSEELSKDKTLSKEEKNQKQEALTQEQKKVSAEFKDLEKKLEDIQKKNQELEQPKKLDDTKQEQKEIEEEQKNSEEELGKDDHKKASERQQKASDKMEEMNEKLKKSMASEEEKEDEINEEALREILENTIQLSNDQEKLMQEFKQVNNYNPQYVESAKKQQVIRDNAKIIEDSLLALSKRVIEIRSFVNREVSKLNGTLDKSVEGFGSRNIGQIRVNQQSAMMHANNLGVMLSEILAQMQEKQQEKKSGKSGGKPKKGKGQGEGKSKSMKSLKQMQDELNKQLREGLNKQEGKDKQNGKGQNGSGEFARMAAQQMAIRQQLQKMMNEMGAKEKEGLGGQGKLQEMQKLMEQTEKELYNKQLSQEMIRRQEQIMTRMLESEKAEKKQEEEKRREAEQAKEKPPVAPPSFEPYLKEKKKEQELLQTIPAEMQPYYKEKTKSYFNRNGKK